MEKRIPAHISIIMDGNGRWAKEKGHERGYGHIHGVESVRKVTQACVEEGVKYLSVYAFSEENWSRPAEEVGFLMNLMMDAISREVETLMKNGVRFRVLGNMERIPSTLQDAIRALEMLKVQMAGETIKPAEKKWNPNVKATNLEVIEDAIGSKIDLVENEQALPLSQKRIDKGYN